MTPETATALLAEMGPTCILCGAVNPPTVHARTQFGTMVPEHEECPKATQKMIAGLRTPSAPSIDDCRDALATVVEHAATIARLERELAERNAAVARLTRERGEAAVYSRDVCDAVENVRVMLAGTLDALDASRARLGTVEGSIWPTT